MKKIFGTKEWAEETLDIQRGCPNGCRYCYAKAEAVRFGMQPRQWHTADIIVAPPKLARLEKSKRALRVMFPAHHDITTVNLRQCIPAIHRLINAGHTVLVVSKPDPAAIDIICRYFSENGGSDRIEFRFTIGSVFRYALNYWEPKAPGLGDRLESLIMATSQGFKTSVSIEPMLDTMPERVVELVRPFVSGNHGLHGGHGSEPGTIWIGLPNFMAQRLAINGEPDNVRQMGQELMESFTDPVVRRIYANLKDDPLIRFKDSMCKRLGLPLMKKSPGVVKAA